MTWKIGDKLQGDKYTIERELGKGRFGITHLAQDGEGKQVVVKTLTDDLLSEKLSPAELEQLGTDLENQSQKLINCNHPHLVNVTEMFTEGKTRCLVMEYIPGVDLQNRTDKILPEQEAVNYIQQIGQALMEVHQQDLCHWDIQPANILIKEGTKEAVLIDFGLSRGWRDALSKTNSKISVNSDGFAPLELYRTDVPRGAVTDVYALAATLYNLLTGVVPPNAMNRSLGKAQLVPPQNLNQNLSDRTNAAILAGLTIKAEERPQTVQAWLKLLELPADQPAPIPDLPVASPALTSTSNPTMPQIILVVALGIFVIIGTIVIGAIIHLSSTDFNPPPKPEATQK